MAILRLDASEEVHARYPANFIMSGQTSRMFGILWTSAKSVIFKKIIYVYTNLSDKPIKLSIKRQGKIDYRMPVE